MIRPLVLLAALMPAAALSQAASMLEAGPPARLESAGDPADRLAGYLRTLATAPRDVEALTGAGRAALDVGDANAAIGFYARAEGLAPRDGRIKAGLGTALLRMGKAREALRLFDQAVDLAVPEADIAAERGLAYDLRGDGRRAQRDYRLALANRPDGETTRRLALSLAIAGDREGAIQLLTPLLYKNDAAAWRARAFVLAMTGDTAGAGTIASAMMLPGQAAAMQPFLARLATLDAAEKARAVHFGEMPSDGTAYSQAELAGFGASTAPRTYRPERSLQPAPTRTVSPAVSAAAPSRQPTTAFLRNRQALLKSFSPDAAQAEVKAMPPAAPVTGRAEALAGASARPPATRPAPTPPSDAVRTPASPAPGASASTVADDTPLMLALNVPNGAARAAAPAKTPAGEAATPGPKRPAEKAAPTAAERRAAEKAKADEARKKKEAAAKAAEAKAAKAHPERIWVQVAGGANRSDLPKAWTQAKAKAGATLAGRSPSTTRVRATNRLLVGPFKTRDDAQALVNKLSGAFIVTTEKGQVVEKLAAK